MRHGAGRLTVKPPRVNGAAALPRASLRPRIVPRGVRRSAEAVLGRDDGGLGRIRRDEAPVCKVQELEVVPRRGRAFFARKAAGKRSPAPWGQVILIDHDHDL
jgi:hypothetical protein